MNSSIHVEKKFNVKGDNKMIKNIKIKNTWNMNKMHKLFGRNIL